MPKVRSVIPYASRTGTRRNLDVLRRASWRLLVSAAGEWRPEGFLFGLDNGAWSAYQSGRPWEADRFRACVALLGRSADWIVVPDIVCGGLESLRFSESWLPELEPLGRLLLIPVQNGMDPADVSPLLGLRAGIFVGGDTAWKEATLPVWGRLAEAVGCHLHVGRVNSARRIRLCALAGAHSFDGTSVTQFAKSIGRLDAARRQSVMPLDLLGGLS